MNHPRVQIWDVDIRAVRSTRCARCWGLALGELDLLAGCPPCQGFSSLRNPQRETRCARSEELAYGRFLAFRQRTRTPCRHARECARSANRRRFREFSAILKNMGYIVNWAVFDAARYGVPNDGAV